MEQIQCNNTTQTAAVSPAIVGEAGQKSDLFPKMLKEQSLSAATPGIRGKKDCGQSEDGKTNTGANGEQTTLGTGAVNQQPPVVSGWFIPTVQGKSMSPPSAALTPLQAVVNPEGTTQNPEAETAGLTVNPKAVSSEEVGFPVAGSYFPGVNTTENQGVRSVDLYAEPPLSTGPGFFSLTGSVFMPQTPGMLQRSSFTQNPLLNLEQGQNAAAVLSPAAGEAPALSGLNAVRQGVSVSGETENAFHPLLQTLTTTISGPGQIYGNQGSAPVMSAAAALGSTPLTGQPKNVSQTETGQSVKTGFLGEMAAQNRGVGHGKLQTTADSGILPQPQSTVGNGLFTQPQPTADSAVSTQPQPIAAGTALTQGQNGEPAELREQRQSADDVTLPNTARVETLSQSQVKTTDQTQNAVRSQLAYQINAHFDKGSKTFEMQLYPKDLGKVNVKMTMEHSTLIVEISAASAKTQSIILANADDIRAMLQSHMHQEVQISLPQEQKSAQQQLAKDEQGSQHNPYSAEDQQAEENEEQQELDTEHFLKTLNMLSEKYFIERNQEYAD